MKYLLSLLLLLLSPQKPINPQALTGNYDASAKTAVFNNQTLPAPALAQLPAPKVLGQTNTNKRIEIDLAKQTLYAYENNQLVYQFLISSGKWGRTPTGTFNIWGKFRYTKMEGGNKTINTYYYLPNVPYVMFFSNNEVPNYKGFSLHGTYWHSNFGHPMSHGCINMKTEEAEKIYYWAMPDLQDKRSILASADNPGTPVIIYGEPVWE